MVGPVDIRRQCRKLVLERITDEALCGKVVEFGRLHAIHDLEYAGKAFQGRRVKLNLRQNLADSPQTVLGVLDGDTANDSVNLVIPLKKVFGQIAAVLAGDARN